VAFRAALVLSVLVLAACGGDSGVRPAQPDGAPISSLAVAAFMGDLSVVPEGKISPGERVAYRIRYKDAFEKRLPAILRANGVPVTAVSVRLSVVRPGSRPPLQDTRFSHVLVLNGYNYRTVSRATVRQLYVNVIFDAELWSTASGRVVWSGRPFLSVVEKQPLLQVEHFAAQILNAMQADRYIALKNGYAVDFEGKRIEDPDVSTPDR
jgi:hypothetical protein